MLNLNYYKEFDKLIIMSTDKAIERCKALTTTTRETYNTIKSVSCPVLEVNVVFNSKGFRHLLYKPDGTPRDVSERIFKLTLFPLAVPVIKNAVGIDEERDVTIRSSRKKKDKKLKKGKTFALVAKVGKKNPVSVRVIVLQVGTGNHIFYSIMKD